jgi:lysozyme family protein
VDGVINDRRFNVCLPFTLVQECPFPNDWSNPKNFSNDPHDPGGATMDGITQAEYTRWCNINHIAPQPVIRIAKDEGESIYYNDYWLPNCPKCLPGLDLCVFDSNVNQGPTQSTRILQFALDIPVDGIWGGQTDAAVKTVKSVNATIQAFTTRREAVYEQTRNFNRFGTDWMRRAEEIGTAAARAGVMRGHALAMYAKYKLTAPPCGGPKD